MNKKVDRSLKIELANLVASLDDGLLDLEEADSREIKKSTKLLLRNLHSLKAILRMSHHESMSKLVHRIEDMVKFYVEQKDYVLDDKFFSIARSSLEYFTKLSQCMVNNKKFRENNKLELSLCEKVESLVGSDYITDTSYSEGDIIIDDEVAEKLGIDVKKYETINQENPDLNPNPDHKENETDEFEDRIIFTSLSEIDQIINLVEELSVNMEMVWYFKNKSELNTSSALEALESAYKAMRKLQRDSMGLKMESLDNTFKSIKRVILDTAKDVDKKVNVTFSGSEIKLENGQIDAIKSPLVHIVRNAVDHGLESAGERKNEKKEDKCHITLKASVDKGMVSISIKDDGKGIDRDKIKKKLVSKGVDTSKLKDDDILNTIFEPGFSTKDSINEISGRGVGLDIVKSELARIGGSVEVNSIAKQGTEFLLSIPSSTIIISCVIVKANNVIYAIPINKVSHIININNYEEKPYSESNTAIIFEGEIVPLWNLGQKLHGYKSVDKEFNAGLVITHGDAKLIVQVDRILDRQKIFMRKLNHSLETPDGIFRGVSILSNGEASLIIDPFSIFKHIENETHESGVAA